MSKLREPRSIWTWATSPIAALLAVYTGYWMSSGRTVFVEIFAAFDVELPLRTRMAFTVPSAAYLAIGILMALIILLKDFLILRDNHRLGINTTSTVLILGGMQVYLYAFQVPMSDLIQKMNG